MKRTVWLASFPKSGNTWVRAIATALGTHPHLFDVDDLDHNLQPFSLAPASTLLGLDPRWLTFDELDVLRDALIRLRDEASHDLPVLRKTHEVYRSGAPGREPFPTAATRAAIYIIRDPRDVACSYAPFFGIDLNTAIDKMGTETEERQGRPSQETTVQPWGTWSSHVRSWLLSELPFPVHRVHYEDLKRDAVGTLLPVLQHVGLPCSESELARAVEMTRFERLQRQEQESGFREVSPRTETFFRKGRDGGWREELSPEQVIAIEADHAEVMSLMGYRPVSQPATRMAVAEARESRRRAESSGRWSLPAHLGIDVTLGSVPETIPGADFAKPWLQLAPGQALLTFADSCRILVEDGSRVRVDWRVDSGDDDPSWVLHGWAVTLAALQRGMLSLHAATVRVGDRIVAIAGNRGAGKSTTAMALRARGHSLLCDDVTLVEFRGDEAWTTPFERNVHLVEDAAAAVGVAAGALPRLSGGRNKFAFRPEAPADGAHRIDCVVVLTRSRTGRPASHAEPAHVEVEKPRGAERVTSLLAHTRRDGLAPALLGEAEYFRQVMRLATSAPITVVRRPVGTWCLDEVVDVIERGT